VRLILSRQSLFWVFIVVTGIMRWLLIGLSVLDLCLFALLDRTPAVRKAIIYIAAALLWGGIRFGYRWVHGALGDGDMTLSSVLVWVDLLLNLAIATVLLREVRRGPPQ
jgi:hypothetical protein